MKPALRLILVAAATLLIAASLSAAGLPRALAAAAGGLWEVSRTAEGKAAQRVCLPDPTVLAQWEHRGDRCTRVVIAGEGTHALFHYSCANGGFGDSEMTMITPRAMRVATQGISRNYPFSYTIHARRVGDCAAS